MNVNNNNRDASYNSVPPENGSSSSSSVSNNNARPLPFPLHLQHIDMDIQCEGSQRLSGANLDKWVRKAGPWENRREAARRIRELQGIYKPFFAAYNYRNYPLHTILDLSGLGLRSIPEEVLKLEPMFLNLEGNRITTFTDEECEVLKNCCHELILCGNGNLSTGKLNMLGDLYLDNTDLWMLNIPENSPRITCLDKWKNPNLSGEDLQQHKYKIEVLRKGNEIAKKVFFINNPGLWETNSLGQRNNNVDVEGLFGDIKNEAS